MATQTIFRSGNSNVVAVPSSFTGLTTGQKVFVEEVPEVNGLLITPATSKRPSILTKEFKLWLDKVLVEDGELLDNLADR